MFYLCNIVAYFATKVVHQLNFNFLKTAIILIPTIAITNTNDRGSKLNLQYHLIVLLTDFVKWVDCYFQISFKIFSQTYLNSLHCYFIIQVKLKFRY